MNRRGFLFGLLATSALVNVPAALAVVSPTETIEQLVARRMKAAEEAVEEMLSRRVSEMMYGDASPPMRGGLADLLDIKPGDLSADDWEEDDPAYVRYPWADVNGVVRA